MTPAARTGGGHGTDGGDAPFSLDESTAERLLSDELTSGGAPVGYHEVAERLDALREPPTPDELAGEAEIVDAMAARIVASERRPARRRRMLVLAAVIGTTVLLGLAAAAGALPNPLEGAVARVMRHVGIPGPTTSGHGANDETGSPPRRNPDARRGDETGPSVEQGRPAPTILRGPGTVATTPSGAAGPPGGNPGGPPDHANPGGNPNSNGARRGK